MDAQVDIRFRKQLRRNYDFALTENHTMVYKIIIRWMNVYISSSIGRNRVNPRHLLNV